MPATTLISKGRFASQATCFVSLAAVDQEIAAEAAEGHQAGQARP